MVFLMGQNPKCPGLRKKQRDNLKYENLQRLFLPPPSQVLTNIHSILASESCCNVSLKCSLPRTHDVGLPTQIRYHVGPAAQPISDSMGQIVYDAGPTLLQHWDCRILSRSTPVNTCHSPNTGSMLAQRIRRWPDIETALGDCPVFA